MKMMGTASSVLEVQFTENGCKQSVRWSANLMDAYACERERERERESVCVCVESLGSPTRIIRTISHPGQKVLVEQHAKPDS